MTSPVVGFYLTCLVLWKTAQMADLKSSPTFHHSTDFVPVDVGAEVYQDDNLQYAAINVHLSNISRQRNETNTECVYSRVYQDDNLQYAALSVRLSNRSRQRNETNPECVYSRVKL
ncbi:hypothetical protein Q8A73_013302 [Channa argus]|nr:hypothetical protein Q8A73_013302 [Channa argus]